MNDKLIGTLPEGVSVIGMVQNKGQIILATSNGVYILRNEGFVPITFVEAPEPIKVEDFHFYDVKA